jgi:hypothetical protein
MNSNRTKLVFVNNGNPPPHLPIHVCTPVRPSGKSLQTVALQWIKVASPAIQKQNGQLQSFIKVKLKCPLKQQTLKQPKSAQLDKVLYKWFTAMCSE